MLYQFVTMVTVVVPGKPARATTFVPSNLDDVQKEILTLMDKLG
jgi:hypothetical protein